MIDFADFKNKLLQIIEDFPDEYKDVKVLFFEQPKPFHFEISLNDEVITSGLFVSEIYFETPFWYSDLWKYSDFEIVFLFDGTSFSSITSYEIQDKIENYLDYPKIYYSLLNYLSDFTGRTTERSFFVYKTRIEDFALNFEIDLKSTIIEVVKTLNVPNSLVKKLNSPILYSSILNKVEENMTPYFNSFWIDGIELDEEELTNGFESFHILYFNLEKPRFKIRLMNEVKEVILSEYIQS
jgi:hypothetical protein